jgi:trk system potassium uptake protein TrkA
MPNCAIIGLGSFGYYIAKFLAENRFEILAIDLDENQVEKVKPYVTKAVIADATQKEVLVQLGVDEMDFAVVSVGDKIDTSILITLYLKELKIKQIIVKSITEDHGKILGMIGASDVVFPERDVAIKLAQSLASPNLIETLSLGPDYSLVELAPPTKFLRKSIKELDIRNKYNVDVLAIKELIPENLIVVPRANHIIKDSDILLLIGKIEDLETIKNLK